jgi:hypothetical protein
MGSGKPVRVAVPIPAAYSVVRRLSVFKEQTKWAGYYVASAQKAGNETQ